MRVGKLLLFLLLSVLFLLLSVLIPRASPEPEEMSPPRGISSYPFPGLQNKVSVDLRNMDVVDVLKFLAIQGNLNIVAGKDVSGPVTLLINEVAVGDALEIVLSLSNLAYEVVGNVIKVMPNTAYKTVYGVEFYDQRQTAIYQLKYASAKNIGAMLGNVKSDVGKVIFDDSTGTVVLIDTPQRLKEMDEIIRRQEMPTVSRVLPTETRIFELKYSKVDDIKEEIGKALTPEIGSMRVDKRSNTLVIIDLPHRLEEIDLVIKAFDRKIREVFIEAKIVEVTLTDTFKWGINWSDLSRYVKKDDGKRRKYNITPQASLPLGLTGTFGKLTIASLATNQLSLVLEFLQTITDTKILSNPHVTVQEGKEASIKVIERQPYQEETTTTASGGTTTTSKTFQWVNVGIQLSVTPTINGDGYINLLIKPEVSSISTWYGGAAQAAGAVPVVKSANAETTVLVRTDTTIMIAGLIKDNKTKSINKIPLLGDIPILGKPFRSVSDDVTRTETIVFLTPRIVTGDESFLLQRDMEKPLKDIRE